MYKIDHVPPDDHQPEPDDVTTPRILRQVATWHLRATLVHPRIAMHIASMYATPSDRDRAGVAFATSGYVEIRQYPDLATWVRREWDTARKTEGSDHRFLGALGAYVDEVVKTATRYRWVLSTGHGHTMLNTGTVDIEQCLECGGTWTLAPDLDRDPDGGYGSYFAANGDHADECQPDGRAHGEEACSRCPDDEQPCQHVASGCNCLHCQ